MRAATLLQPAPKSTPDRWGAENRVYPLTAGRPGKRDPEITPYAVPFGRALADPRYETAVFVTGTQSGKALALDTLLPTPSGWTTMGEVRLGDTLHDERGQPCRVIAVSPVMHDRDCYRVEFCDGSSIVASGDHLWTVEQFQKHRGSKDRATRTMTTDEIIKRGVLRENGAARFSIRVTAALDLPDAALPIAPYVLGVWLGDGNSRCARVSSGDQDVTEMTALLTAERLEVRATRERTCWSLSLPSLSRGEGLHAALRAAGLLTNKHIPAAYLRASIAQRWALLQGLMDTDGTASGASCTFTSKLERLAAGVLELACSLGLRARLKRKVRKGYVSWDVAFAAYADTPVFRLARKQARLASSDEPGRRPHENDRRYIRAIVPVERVPVRCIGIDSPSRLYLAGERMIPTHNTDTILDVIGWQLDTRPRPILYVGPSRDFVAEQFEPRLMALFDESARLRSRVARGKRLKKTRKIVNGVPIRLGWAGSPTSLSSDQAGLIFVDEYSKMFAKANKGGDPYVLAKARGDTYADRKIGVTSTAENGKVETEKDAASGLEFWKVMPSEQITCRTWLLWQTGTRHHMAWRCPSCEEWFIPRYRDLQFPEGATPAEARRSTYLCCPVNGCVIDEASKHEMNAGAKPVAPGEFIRPDGTIGGDPPDSTTYSLWASGLMSPFLSWGERVEEMLKAQAVGDPTAEKAAINKVGELWFQTPVSAITEDHLTTKVAVGHRLGDVPAEVVKLTLGADVQGNRIVYVVRGWGAMARSWPIATGEVWGRTAEIDVWSRFALILQEEYGGLRIERGLIDSGFRPDKREAGDYHKVYDFCRQWSWVIMPAKGKAQQSVPVVIRPVEATAEAKRETFTLQLAHLDSDYFKSLVHSRLWTPSGQPQSMMIAEDSPEQYRKELLSEVRNDAGEWHKVYSENHFLDAEALAAAAGYILQVHRIPEGTRRESGFKKMAETPAASEQDAKPAEASTSARARAASWAARLNRR